MNSSGRTVFRVISNKIADCHEVKDYMNGYLILVVIKVRISNLLGKFVKCKDTLVENSRSHNVCNIICIEHKVHQECVPARIEA